jgi:hypothetical protein
MVKQLKIQSSEAQRIAVIVLNFIGSDPEYLGGFLAATGLGPTNLREAARDPRFLGAVLTYICDDEQMLIECAKATDTAPEDISRAYEVLVGRIEPDHP